MIKASVVIGYNTDPGIVTSFLCSQKPAIVVRVNGSANDTSMVCRNDEHYSFGHIGSGVLQYADTYLSPYFVMNPLLLYKELQQLTPLGIYPKISAHYDCLITTPYDMWLSENCGKHDCGFEETLQRSQNPKYALQFKDIAHTEVSLTLKILRMRDEYFMNRVKQLSLDISQAAHLMSDEFIENFIYENLYLLKNIGGWNKDSIVLQENVIFEGVPQMNTIACSQTNSVLQNAVILLQKSGINELNVFYTIKYTSLINLDELKHTIINDKNYLSPDIDNVFNIVLTHIDESENISILHHDNVCKLSCNDVIKLMQNELKMKVWCNVIGNNHDLRTVL